MSKKESTLSGAASMKRGSSRPGIERLAERVQGRGETIRFNANVPVDVHTAFKVKVTQDFRGQKNMKDVVVRLMEMYVDGDVLIDSYE